MAFKMNYTKGGFPFKKTEDNEFKVKDQQARRTDRPPQTATRKSTTTDVKPQSQGGTGKQIRYGGDSPLEFNKDYQKNRKVKRAKRITRKHVKNTTSDSPDFDSSKFDKSEKRMMKADKLLQKAGYGLGEREEALGAGGYEAAMDWAKKGKNKKTNKKSTITDDYAEMNPDHE